MRCVQVRPWVFFQRGWTEEEKPTQNVGVTVLCGDGITVMGGSPLNPDVSSSRLPDHRAVTVCHRLPVPGVLCIPGGPAMQTQATPLKLISDQLFL